MSYAKIQLNELVGLALVETERSLPPVGKLVRWIKSSFRKSTVPVTCSAEDMSGWGTEIYESCVIWLQGRAYVLTNFKYPVSKPRLEGAVQHPLGEEVPEEKLESHRGFISVSLVEGQSPLCQTPREELLEVSRGILAILTVLCERKIAFAGFWRRLSLLISPCLFAEKKYLLYGKESFWGEDQSAGLPLDLILLPRIEEQPQAKRRGSFVGDQDYLGFEFEFLAPHEDASLLYEKMRAYLEFLVFVQQTGQELPESYQDTDFGKVFIRKDEEVYIFDACSFQYNVR